jgi:PAS domain S-box-containing protein
LEDEGQQKDFQSYYSQMNNTSPAHNPLPESKLLAAIVDSSDDAIISKDLQGTITSWNKAAEKIFGYTPEEAIGRNIRMLLPKNLLGEEDMIIEKIKKGEKVIHYETIRLKKNGTPLHISLTVSPIKDPNGNIIGASKISRDITEKVMAQKELESTNQKLEELHKFKDHFIAIATHEFKTPLTVIKANLQLLEMQVKTTEYKGITERTLKQVDKLTSLIADLLDVSKMQLGQLEINPTQFDLVALTKEVIDNLQITASHTITSHFPEQPIMVCADRARIEQVIINMLSNAIKYAPDSKKIIVSAKEENDKVIFSVQDFGMGIPEKDIENIFTRFFRVKEIASSFSGSGIGLYISDQIMRAHNGRIWVNSKPGEGSTFYFMLPK